jgi:hypothetical protein
VAAAGQPQPTATEAIEEAEAATAPASDAEESAGAEPAKAEDAADGDKGTEKA